MWKRRGFRQAGSGAVAAMLAVCMAAFAPARAESGDAAPAVQMHRAVYDLSLDRVKNVSDIEGLQGRMVVEWRGGSACGGYISDQRVVILSSDAQGNSSTNDVRLSSWESLDGGEFRFERTEYANGELAARESGQVRRGLEGVVLEMEGKKPQRLPAAVLFPTAFNLGLIQAAAERRTMFSGLLFDGSQSGMTAVTAFIGKPAPAPADARAVKIENQGDGTSLKSALAWPVRMSYFDSGDSTSEQDGTPSFEMGARLFPNGVMSSLLLDYEDASVKGELTKLEYFRPGSC
jgi:hypothetical protein